MSFKFETTKKCLIDKASNGQEAFEFVQKKLNNEPSQFYDLVVLDLQMPITNGYEACEQIVRLFYSNQLGHEELDLLCESPSI